MCRHPRAALLEEIEEAGQIGAALAHRRPLRRHPLRRFPEHRVAEARREHVRSHRGERGERILERPAGVARVEVDAHIVRPGRLDERLQFPRLHVAGMVFHRDLHAAVDRPRALGLQHLDRIGDPGTDAAIGKPVVAIAEDHTEGRRAQGLRHPDAERQMLLGAAPVVLECLGRRADAPRAQCDGDAAIDAVATDVVERGVVEAAVKGAQVGDEERVAPERFCVVDELPRVPLHGPHGEVVEPQRNAAAADVGGHQRCGHEAADG